ncbi:hypothetical protein [Desulfonatronum thioautotrophicum]|uniref:hypothetical protein n=1 Tax=Desulfonatronum thioautotrophicum TaxID=617001 RepID=UPI0005EB3A1A|nr:hypothetical protein [Desulfonatronum thioautotrophicum]
MILEIDFIEALQTKKSSLNKRGIMTEQNIKSTFCITMPSGSIIVFEADDNYWYQPCWVVEGQDTKGVPTVRFMPVQKYGMSELVEPFDRRHYLCMYPAEPGIEDHYKSFVTSYHEYLRKDFN